MHGLRNNPVKSIFWIMVWSLSFTVTMSLAKVLGGEVSIFTMVFVRSFFGFFFLLPLIHKNGWRKTLKTNRLPLHIARAMFACAAISATYYAYGHLSMTLATSVGFLQPLMVTLLAVIFLSEHVSWDKWIAIAVGYMGVFLLINPLDQGFDPDILMAILANALSSGAIILSRKMSDTEDPITLIVYAGAAVFGMSAVLASFYWRMPDLDQLLILLAMGGTGTLAQLGYVEALHYGEASLVAPFEYSRLVMAVPIGIFFFAEYPTLMMLAASVVIILSNLYIARAGMRKQ